MNLYHISSSIVTCQRAIKVLIIMFSEIENTPEIPPNSTSATTIWYSALHQGFKMLRRSPSKWLGRNMPGNKAFRLNEHKLPKNVSSKALRDLRIFFHTDKYKSKHVNWIKEKAMWWWESFLKPVGVDDNFIGYIVSPCSEKILQLISSEFLSTTNKKKRDGQVRQRK